MKTPEQRKTESEALLHKRGIRINVMLPLTESNEEIQLRTADEVSRRLYALWAASSASVANNTFVREHVLRHRLQPWLSAREQALLAAKPFPESAAPCAAASEHLFFLAWCAGLIKRIDMPSQESTLKPLLQLFPQTLDQAPSLLDAIRLRSKDDIMGWADLLYRLHWAVRHAHLTGRPTPGNLDHRVLEGWHKAANWMIRYEDEDDWDLVGTDT